MKKLSTLIILLSIVGYAFGQKSVSALGQSIAIGKCEVEDSRYASRYFASALRKVMDDEYELAARSPLTVTGDAHVLDTKTIEGMETYTYVELEVNITLTDLIFNEKSNKSITVKGKSSGKDKAIIAAINQLSKNKEVRADLLKFVNDHVDAMSGARCSELVAKVRSHIAMDDYSNAYLTLDYIDPDSSCGGQRSALRAEAIEGYKQAVCERTLQRAKIMVNSKDEKKMSNAIDLLLQIPPGAPCEGDALDLATQIGAYNEDLSSKRTEILNKYVLQLEEMDQDSWMEGYRRRLYSSKR